MKGFSGTLPGAPARAKRARRWATRRTPAADQREAGSLDRPHYTTTASSSTVPSQVRGTRRERYPRPGALAPNGCLFLPARRSRRQPSSISSVACTRASPTTGRRRGGSRRLPKTPPPECAFHMHGFCIASLKEDEAFQAPLLVVPFRQFQKVSAWQPYYPRFPGGVSPRHHGNDADELLVA